MSRFLSNFRLSGSVWLWAVCGLVAVSLTQGSSNHSGLARAAVCCIMYDLGDRFPPRSSLYESTTQPSFPNSMIDIELVSLSLLSTSPISFELPQPGETVQVDSFFDVFTELRTPGGSFHVDSFFDITYRLHGVSGSPTETIVEIELVAMVLDGLIPPSVLPPGTVDPLPLRLRESPTLPSLGLHQVTELAPGGPYQIDSFFDVFTELSLDGGQNWIPSSGPVRMELTRVGVPEPSSLLLAGLVGIAGLGVHVRRQMKRYFCCKSADSDREGRSAAR